MKCKEGRDYLLAYFFLFERLLLSWALCSFSGIYEFPIAVHCIQIVLIPNASVNKSG